MSLSPRCFLKDVAVGQTYLCRQLTETADEMPSRETVIKVSVQPEVISS